MKKINFSSKRGFTLIELLVVIGILAVLAAIMIPMVSGVIMKANVSADKTNSNEMTNSIERFASEYELYCQDIASGKIKNVANLDGAQGRVYNVTLATTRSDIEKLESEEGFNGRAIDGDTNYPTNRETARAIVQVYTKTSSSTFEPKQSDAHYYYSPDCGIVVAQDTTKSDVASLNALVPSGLDASGKALDSNTEWIDLTEEVSIDAGSTEEVTNYTLDEINADEHLYAIGKTKPEYVVAKFNDDYSEVTIFANGDDSDGFMMDWAPWINNTRSPMQLHRTTLTKAIIQNGIINIGNSNAGQGAFSGCTNLTTVSLPNTLKSIGQSAFSTCCNLSNIKLPNSLENLGSGIFSECFALSSITVPEGITIIPTCIFSACKNLKTVILPNTITTIEHAAFAYCEKLENIQLPQNVISIESHAFEDCDALTSVLTTSNISQIEEGTFTNCDGLIDITISTNITQIGYGVFYGCNNLSVVRIHKNVSAIFESAFIDITDEAIIYCETQEVADLLEKDIHYNGTTQVVVDPSKF